MKINEALDIINDTRTVRAKFEKSKLTFAAKENLGGGHWGFWFLRMNEGALSWNSVNLAYPYLNSVSAQDLARVMDVVQQLLDTPVKERFPEKKYRLRWLDSADIGFGTKTYMGRCQNPKGRGKYWTTYCEHGAELFTETELEKLKHDNPRWTPAIDAMKEEVKDDD